MESREFAASVPEFTPPGPEFDRDAALEFGTLPLEFPDRSTAETEDTGRRRRALRKWLLAAAAAALAVFLFVRFGPTGPAAPDPADPEPTPPAEESVTPPAEEQPEETELQEEPPGELPEEIEEVYAVFPLADGTIHVTVYNDTFDLANMDWDNYQPGDDLRILLREDYAEATFTELTLPEPDTSEDAEVDDYTFAGWVLHYGNPMDLDYTPDPENGPFARAVGDTLTREEVEWVPVSDDGVRYVNIHAMWLPAENEDAFLPLVLDDGMGGRSTYEGSTPYASEGYVYLAAFPAPEREDYVFTGWYDPEGNRVEAVAYTDFLDPIDAVDWEGNPYTDYDWGNPHPVVLTAGWREQ